MATPPVPEALDALSRFLVADASMGDTLHRVAEISTEAIPAARFAGIAMLGEKGQVTTAVFTDDQAPEIDSAQYATGRGPCLDAWRQKRTVRLDDVSAERDGEYAEFADACIDHGIHSTLSLPLVSGDRGIGALNLYASTTGGFTPDDEAVTAQLAATASVVLANAAAYWGAYDLSQQMSEAMQSRAISEQAKGMLMASSPDLTAEEAFGPLSRASQRENVKLRDIAQRIVERHAVQPE